MPPQFYNNELPPQAPPSTIPPPAPWETFKGFYIRTRTCYAGAQGGGSGHPPQMLSSLETLAESPFPRRLIFRMLSGPRGVARRMATGSRPVGCMVRETFFSVADWGSGILNSRPCRRVGSTSSGNSSARNSLSWWYPLWRLLTLSLLGWKYGC